MVLDTGTTYRFGFLVGKVEVDPRLIPRHIRVVLILPGRLSYRLGRQRPRVRHPRLGREPPHEMYVHVVGAANVYGAHQVLRGDGVDGVVKLPGDFVERPHGAEGREDEGRVDAEQGPHEPVHGQQTSQSQHGEKTLELKVMCTRSVLGGGRCCCGIGRHGGKDTAEKGLHVHHVAVS